MKPRAHWEVERLKYLATLNDDTLPESTDPNFEMAYVDISSVDAVTGITEIQTVVLQKAPSRARRVVRHGDVIVSTVRTYLRAIAAIEVPTSNLIVSTGFAVIRPRQIESSFASYALRGQHFVERVVANSVGVSYPAINASTLACFPIPYPEIDEQRAIADFLDRETAKIDGLVERKERLIELLQEKRTSLITRVVTRGLDPNVPMKDSGVEWLGEIPASLGREASLAPGTIRAQDHVRNRPPRAGHVDDGVPIVKGGDVAAARLKLDALSKTTFEVESLHIRSRLTGGDLVYAIRGSIGDVEMVPDELDGANLTQDAARVAYMRTTHGGWLMYALRSQAVFSQLEAGALGATIKGINIRDLKRAVIPVPRKREQEQIASFLDMETARIDTLIAKIRQAIDLLKEFRTALISAAVTGKIDVREEAP